jgi:hypothetical protein
LVRFESTAKWKTGELFPKRKLIFTQHCVFYTIAVIWVWQEKPHNGVPDPKPQENGPRAIKLLAIQENL